MPLSPVPAGSSTRAAPAPRLLFVDLLRGLAAQVIVLHHIALYGPLSDTAYALAPGTIDFFFGYGRFAVQVFFVVGGFLAAQSLAKAGPIGPRALLGVAVRRYRRIGFPYLASLVVAIVANNVADRFMDHSSISGPPDLTSVLAHVFLLQSILGIPAITAGIWYIAVEFQLLVLVFALTGLAQALVRAPLLRFRVQADSLAHALFGALALSALFWFNRDKTLDMWAIYFFGSYFLGMLLYRVVQQGKSAWQLGVYLLLMCAAVAVDYRPRLLLAAAVGALVYGAAKLGVLDRWPNNAIVAYCNRTSYSLFLIHFPVCLVVNALVWHRDLSPVAAVFGMAAAFGASHVAAFLFHRYVEVPCMRDSRPDLPLPLPVVAAAAAPVDSAARRS